MRFVKITLLIAACMLLFAACSKSSSGKEEKAPTLSFVQDISNVVILRGAQKRFTVTKEEGDDDTPAQWVSSNRGIVEVEDGLVIAKAVGQAKIKAKKGKRIGYFDVTVEEPFPHDYVDLGLSVYWATTNLGANYVGEYGDYFAWGEAESKPEFYWWNYAWWISFTGGNNVTKYCSTLMYGYVDNIDNVLLEDDAARWLWGDKWRTPTEAELDELLTQTITYKSTYLGNPGTYFKNKNNSELIFLPYSRNKYLGTAQDVYRGYYWTATVRRAQPTKSYYLRLDPNYAPYKDQEDRFIGMSIRPVRDKD